MRLWLTAWLLLRLQLPSLLFYILLGLVYAPIAPLLLPFLLLFLVLG